MSQLMLHGLGRSWVIAFATDKYSHPLTLRRMYACEDHANRKRTCTITYGYSDMDWGRKLREQA